MDRAQLITFAANFLLILKNLLTYALIARILLSWFAVSRPSMPKGAVTRFLHDVTDPLLNVAKKLPHKIGMIDLSPLIVLLGLDLFAWIIIDLLSKI